MAAEADSNNIIRFTYTGEENIPREATHIFVDAAFVPDQAFNRHPNIVELICHDKVKKIKMGAFRCCPSLRRVIMPGVKEVEGWGAFEDCRALEDVECGKLEIIGVLAFGNCKSLRSISLPSARIVRGEVFCHCTALTDVKFGSKLERIDDMVFYNCTSLERIAIPLTDGIFDEEDIFQDCDNFRQVDLAEGQLVHATIAALHLEEWRNDMNEEIDSINRILPNARAGHFLDGNDPGEKAVAIRTWIVSVLNKFYGYAEEHERLLDDAATSLQLVLPQDLVMNNVRPFLQLPEEEE